MGSHYEIIIRLFNFVDNCQWDKLADLFTPEFYLDYSSMEGQSGKVNRDECIKSWQGFLGCFDFTHHQLGNFLVNEQGDKATVNCYVTASHWLSSEEEKLWKVVGSYDFELSKHEKGWQIHSMIFNCKFQYGNLALPEAVTK